MKIVGERYLARATITYPHGVISGEKLVFNDATMNLGDTPPEADEVSDIQEVFDREGTRLREKGLNVTVEEPVLVRQEQRARRIMGLPLRTWHVVEVTSFPTLE